MQTTEQNKAIVRRLYEELVNSDQGLVQVEAIFDPYFTGAGIGSGPSAFAEAVRELRQAFSDLEWTVHDVFGEGDKVAVRWSWRGMHTGTFRGYAASGKTVTNNANVIYQFIDGKIIHSWLQNDRLGVLQQIEAV